jgi:hypothetical protein
MLSAFTPALAREYCTTDPSAGSCPTGRREPEPVPAGVKNDAALVAHGVPHQHLARLADHAPTDGFAMAIPRPSVFGSCLGARRQAASVRN